MPKLLSINEVINLEGEPIPMIKGVLKKLWDPKSGRKNGKKWSLQAGVIQDARDDSIEADIAFWNRDDFDFEEGDTVVIIAKEGRNGWSGIKCEYDDDRSKDKDRDIWKITVNDQAQVLSHADYKSMDEDGGGSRRRVRGDDDEAETPRRPARRGHTPDNNTESVTEPMVIARLYQQANLYLRCLGMAASVCEVASTNSGPKFSSEDIRCMATNFYMDLKKRDVLEVMNDQQLELSPAQQDEEPEPEPKPRRRRQSARVDPDDQGDPQDPDPDADPEDEPKGKNKLPF